MTTPSLFNCIINYKHLLYFTFQGILYFDFEYYRQFWPQTIFFDMVEYKKTYKRRKWQIETGGVCIDRIRWETLIFCCTYILMVHISCFSFYRASVGKIIHKERWYLHMRSMVNSICFFEKTNIRRPGKRMLLLQHEKAFYT